MPIKSNVQIKRMLLYAALVPLSWMFIGTVGVVLSFVLPLQSSASTSLFFFPQYSHSFYAAYKIVHGQTVYLFPHIKATWLFGVLSWLLLSFGFAFLMRKKRTLQAIVAAPIVTLLFMLIVRHFLLKFGYQIPLEGP